MRIFTGFVLLLLGGCTGDLVELAVGGRQDMSFAGVDMAQGNNGEMGPNAKFFPDIQMDLDTKGCTIATCHGGTQTPVVKANATGAQIDTNYNDFLNTCVQGKCVDTTNPAASLVLTKNITPGHSGGAQLSNTSDPTYMKWLAWIQAGAPKQ
jgi:hypothetical protein